MVTSSIGAITPVASDIGHLNFKDVPSKQVPKRSQSLGSPLRPKRTHRLITYTTPIKQAKSNGLGPDDVTKAIVVGGKAIREPKEDGSAEHWAMLEMGNLRDKKCKALEKEIQAIETENKKKIKRGTFISCTCALLALVVAAYVLVNLFRTGHSPYPLGETTGIVIGVGVGLLLLAGVLPCCIYKKTSAEIQKTKAGTQKLVKVKECYDQYKNKFFLAQAHTLYMETTRKSSTQFPPHLESFMFAPDVLADIKAKVQKIPQNATHYPTQNATNVFLTVQTPTIARNSPSESPSPAPQGINEWPVTVPEET